MDVTLPGRAPSVGRLHPVTQMLREKEALERELGRLALWNDPRNLYGHCLCGEEWP